MQQHKRKQPSSPLLIQHMDGYRPKTKVYTPSLDVSISDASESDNINPYQSTHSLPSGGTSSIFGVFQNFLNALVGAGILGIPSVYAQCGIIGGIGLMVIFAVLSTYTMNLLIRTAQKYRVSEYEELGQMAFGSVGYIASAMALFLIDFGSCLNYLIILGDASFKVIQLWGYDQLIDRQLVIIIVSMLLIFPPCLWRDISLYERFSGIKILGVGAVIAVVVYQWIQYRVRMEHENDGFVHKWTPTPSDLVWFNMAGIPGAVGIVAYCFVAHDTAFIFYNTLSNPTTLRWSQTVLLSVGSAMILSLILSIAAYFTFGTEVQGNVLNNYPVHDTSMIITRAIYVVMMALTFPTAFFVVRHVVYAAYCRMMSLIRIRRFKQRTEQIEQRLMINANDPNSGDSNPRRNSMSGNRGINSRRGQREVDAYAQSVFEEEYTVKNAPLLHHVVCTSILFFIPLILSMWILDLGTAMSIIGSLSSVQLAFVMPCLTHIKASEYGFGSFVTEETMRGKWNAWKEIYPPFILAVFGVCLGVYGVIDVV